MTLPDPTPSGTTPSWSTTPFSFTSNAAPATADAATVVSVTLLETDAVYVIVPDANAGINVTPLNDSALRLASADPARVTITVYVCVVSPSCAVTTTVITLSAPTASGTMPSWSTMPLIRISYAEPALATVAATVTALTSWATSAV